MRSLKGVQYPNSQRNRAAQQTKRTITLGRVKTREDGNYWLLITQIRSKSSDTQEAGLATILATQMSMAQMAHGTISLAEKWSAGSALVR